MCAMRHDEQGIWPLQFPLEEARFVFVLGAIYTVESLGSAAIHRADPSSPHGLVALADANCQASTRPHHTPIVVRTGTASRPWPRETNLHAPMWPCEAVSSPARIVTCPRHGPRDAPAVQRVPAVQLAVAPSLDLRH